jgi:hypothetical protein
VDEVHVPEPGADHFSLREGLDEDAEELEVDRRLFALEVIGIPEAVHRLQNSGA